jgi:uncharacterized protein YecT (DUF1311 family)
MRALLAAIIFLVTLAGSFAAVADDEMFGDKELAALFELSKTCSKTCENAAATLVRLTLQKNKIGFLITTNNQDFCGSGGCLGAVVVVSGNKFVKLKEGVGISETEAVSVASGGPDSQALLSSKPSFDCAKAITASGRLICSDQELSKADSALAAKFKAATADADQVTRKKLIEEQLVWLRRRNSECAVGPDKASVPTEQLKAAKSCMLQALQARLTELTQTTQNVQTATPSSSRIKFICTNNYYNFFWAEITMNPNDVIQFADDTASARFLDGVRTKGIAFCAAERAAGRCCGPSAYPNNIRIDVTSNNVKQLIATGDMTGAWRIDSLPRTQRLALIEAQRKQDEARRAQLATEEARRDFAAGTGDPVAGIWKSPRNTITIRKDGQLYLVRVEGDTMLRGEYAGPYKDSQIQLGGLAGNISVIPSSAQLIFGGERFSKFSQ